MNSRLQLLKPYIEGAQLPIALGNQSKCKHKNKNSLEKALANKSACCESTSNSFATCKALLKKIKHKSASVLIPEGSFIHFN